VAHDAIDAARQVWPAFVLVAGLLLVGVVAELDGLFAAAGGRLGRLPIAPPGLLVAGLLLVAAVTAVLNLDTSVFFLTPVLLHLARSRGLDETPFLYGVVFMSNAASLCLPGSNLTNLIALHARPSSGAAFLGRMWPAALASVVVTTVVLLAVFRRQLRADGQPVQEPVRPRWGLGVAAVAVSAVLVLVLSNPALPVLAVGVVAILLERPPRARVLAAVDARMLGVLFVLAVVLGAVGRAWDGPASLANGAGRAGGAVVAAVATVLVNNLPAAVLFTPHAPAHPRALLIGLNLGPNLAVTGSLSALLWLRVARSLGARPSARTYSLVGVVLVPLSLAGALGATWLLAAGGF
jgi:arsenical pump membrane protein